MKSKSGNTCQNKHRPGISNMEKGQDMRPTKRNIEKKLNDINKTNGEFMTYAQEKASWLVTEFFREKKR